MRPLSYISIQAKTTAMTIIKAGANERIFAMWTQEAGTPEHAIHPLKSAIERFQKNSHALYYELALDQWAKSRLTCSRPPS